MAKKTREQKKRARATKERHRHNSNPFKVKLNLPPDFNVYEQTKKEGELGMWVAKMTVQAAERTMEHFKHPPEKWSAVGNTLMRLGMLMAEQPSGFKLKIDSKQRELNSVFDQYEYYLKMMEEGAEGSEKTQQMFRDFGKVKAGLEKGEPRANFSDEEIESWQKVNGIQITLRNDEASKYPEEDIIPMTIEILETAALVMGEPKAMNSEKVMYREDMQGLVCGCNGINCNHGGDGLFLNQLCHTVAGVFAEVKDEVLKLSCPICWMPVARVAVERKDCLFTPSCHLGSVEAFLKDGTVTITCRQCKGLLETLQIRAKL